MKKNILSMLLITILLISAVPTSAEKQCQAPIEPGMFAAGHSYGEAPWVQIEMGNAAGNSLSRLRYRTGTGSWHYVPWKGKCGEIITYKLTCAKKAKPGKTEVQRVSVKNRKVLESLYF